MKREMGVKHGHEFGVQCKSKILISIVQGSDRLKMPITYWHRCRTCEERERERERAELTDVSVGLPAGDSEIWGKLYEDVRDILWATRDAKTLLPPAWRGRVIALALVVVCLRFRSTALPTLASSRDGCIMGQYPTSRGTVKRKTEMSYLANGYWLPNIFSSTSRIQIRLGSNF
jgi:hypothetical protein